MEKVGIELKANYHVVLHSVAGLGLVWHSIFSKLSKNLQNRSVALFHARDPLF